MCVVGHAFVVFLLIDHTSFFRMTQQFCRSSKSVGLKRSLGQIQFTVGSLSVDSSD